MKKKEKKRKEKERETTRNNYPNEKQSPDTVAF
jgi:hypothetical protein